MVVEAITYNEEEVIEKIDKDLGEDFRRNHSIVAYNYTHMVFPGFYALFRWIYGRGDSIYFFSSGIEERNIELVNKLMKKSFADEAEKVIPNIKVFSRHHCIDTRHMSEEEGKKYQPDRLYGQRKKKLEGIVVAKEELPYTLLIDDDSSYKVRGEEENLFYVQGTMDYYTGRRGKEEFRSFHKAYYIRGILEKIIHLADKKNINLTKAATMFEMEFVPYKESRQFDSLYEAMIPYFESGLVFLQALDPELKFYFN